MQDVTGKVHFKGGPSDIEEGGLDASGMRHLLKDFAGCVKTKRYTCAFYDRRKEAARASKLLNDHGDDVVVIMSVSAPLIREPEDEFGFQGGDHFVRLLRPIDWTDKEVEAEIYTWGSTKTLKMRPDDFRQAVDGHIVGARDDAIKL